MTLENKKQQILELVKEYIQEKHLKKWDKNKEWVPYSGAVYDENEYVAAIDCLLDEWLIFGRKSGIFEEEFPKFLGKKRGVLTNSGSSANLLMLSAAKSKNLCNLKSGDKIITPVVCFPTTVNPIIQLGFEPIFVDVVLPSLNLDLNQVESILEKDNSIKAIVFAHVLGNPPDMDRVMHLVNKYNLYLFEDCCDALGSTYKGKKLGSFGYMSTCSFFPAHHMTMGEGGFVATDDSGARKVLSSIRDWGRGCYCNLVKAGNVVSETACRNRFKNWLSGMPDITYDHRYVFDEIGYNLKPLDLQAAMGLEQIKKLDYFDAARKNNFQLLLDIFKKYEDYFWLSEKQADSDPSWFAFLLTVKQNSLFKKQDFIDFLEKNRIQTRSYFSGNILAHSAYSEYAKKYDNLSCAFPVAKTVTENSFFIGTYIGLTEEKISYIKEIVDLFFTNLIGKTK